MLSLSMELSQHRVEAAAVTVTAGVIGLEPDPGWLLRPAVRADTDALRVFLTGLSLRSRYLRFFAGVLPVTPAFLGRMTGGVTARGELVDALVVTGPGKTGPVIGHGMATDTTDDAGRAVTDLGVVVADAHQGRGAGSALIRALTARAQARGATTLAMDVLAENREMLGLIAHYFPVARYSRTGPYVSVHVQLPVHQEEPAREPASIVSPGDLRRTESPPADADLPVG
jgi:ribosomal protein S18 acetylase RimI-like enzyme